MPIRRSLLLVLSAWMVLAWGGPVGATIDNLKSFKLAYPGKDPKAYSCKVCHLGAIGKKGDLNAYGLALQKLTAPPVDPRKLTEKEYRAIEQDDADGDKVSNLDELTAGTDPGNPKSVPEGVTQQHPPTTPAPGENAPTGSGEKPSSEIPGVWRELQAYVERQLIATAWASGSEEAQPSGTTKSSGKEAPARAEYVGMETCAMCHEKQAKEFEHSTHARINIPGETKAQGCETCHGPGSLHAEAGGGKGVGGIINPKKDPSTCFECHLDKKAEFRLPYHHPLLEGKMSCSDCHNAHGEDVRPWSATTVKDVNEACFKCHKEQRGPFVWEHEALREGCVTCHKVHGSIQDKMLLARDSNLCLRCHTQTNFPTVGRRDHTTNLTQGTCFSGVCHTAVHGSNFDDHLRY